MNNLSAAENNNGVDTTALLANVCYYNPTHCKRDFGSGGGLQTSCVLRFTVGGSMKTLGDLTHPAISGFYIASYGKAVIFENSAGS